MLNKIVEDIEEEINQIECDNKDFICSTCLTTLNDLQSVLPKLKELKDDFLKVIEKLLNTASDFNLSDVSQYTQCIKQKWFEGGLKKEDEDIFEWEVGKV